jgi:large conductance mechanosensitive channel
MDATLKARTLAEEFRNFAFKGNVIDLAVGVIIGQAFGNIVTSLVNHIIMPVLGLVLPGQEGYAGWALKVGGATVPYGQFIGAVVNFLIVALALFFFTVKFLGLVLKSKQQAPPPLSKDQELLTEIRDLLKKEGTAGAPVGAG